MNINLNRSFMIGILWLIGFSPAAFAVVPVEFALGERHRLN